MARNHRDLQPDLAWLDRLPGTKVLSRREPRPLVERRRARSARCSADRSTPWEATPWKSAASIVCGTEGRPPATEELPPEQQAVVDRELGELDRALEQAVRLRTEPRAAALRPLALSSLRLLRPARALGVPRSRRPGSRSASTAICTPRASGRGPSRGSSGMSATTASPPTRSAFVPSGVDLVVG